ncbi:MAG: tRNA pseudouridine(38-40) synthase TruA [Acidobacteriota bacterium]|jgi:tRNA pseudouridine38-40 synthase
MVYRLTVAYRGAAYAGWQRQDNALAVQQVLERALARLLAPRPAEDPAEDSPQDRPVVVSAASRTDAGVHARGQVVHLARPAEPAASVSLRGLVLGTNTHLPEDVRVMAAARVPDGFHARKCAAGKEYSYRLTRAEVVSPLDAPTTVRVGRRWGRELDLSALAEASKALVGRHDFSAFAIAGGAHTQPFRTVRSAVWEEDGEELRFRVVGDGFLRGMVRGLVGTLLEVASGRRSVAGFAELLRGARRSEAGPTAPAHGLVLERVVYGEEWAALEAWPRGGDGG